MADEPTPPPQRQMSLIPYPDAAQLEVVLRRGSQVVVYDAHSHQLQVRDESDKSLELTECPYCRRPYRDDHSTSRENGSPERGRSATFHAERPFVDPEYFGMLAASQRASPSGTPGTSTPSRRLVPAALRSGRSRDVSGTAVPPGSGAHSSGAEFLSSAPAQAAADGISSSAFSPGFFKQFFVEQGVLGKGGNGVVLLVEHIMDRVSLGQFACKRVPVGNNHAWLEKVLVEVKLLQKIPHRNLVQYHWVWLEDHQPNRFGPSIPCLWILQEYCNGGDLHSYVLGPKEEPSTAEKLKERMRRKSKGEPEPPVNLNGHSTLTFDEIFSFFKDITSGLHHLHSKNYIHRDLKPSNCLLQHDGPKIRVLISDFGEVQAAGATRGSTGATGTISYCAPEVLRRNTPGGAFGDFTTKSDIFSLGMIVYFMCFGRLPYNNADDINEENEDLDELRAEIMKWVGFNDEARLRPDLPEKLYKYLKRLLSVDPNDRPSTGEILDSIRAGGNLGDASTDDGSPRVSSVDSPLRRPGQPQRNHSGFVNRPGLSSLSREDRHSRSSAKSSRSQNLSGESGGNGSRPLSPVDQAVAVRPWKVDLPGPSEGSPAPQSPRLMLPPPPQYQVASSIMWFIRQPSTINGFRAALFAVKILLLFLPCAPYAPTGWLLYPLLGLAALDIGILGFDLRQSTLLFGLHFAAVMLGSHYGDLCERPPRVWEGI